MNTQITVVADSVDSARFAATNQVRAQGFRNVTVFSTIPAGDRQYQVSLIATK